MHFDCQKNGQCCWWGVSQHLSVQRLLKYLFECLRTVLNHGFVERVAGVISWYFIMYGAMITSIACVSEKALQFQVVVSNHALEFKLWCQTLPWSSRCGVKLSLSSRCDVISHKLWCLISPWSSSCGVLLHPGVQVVSVEPKLWCQTTP